jgi:hypothetical protein
MTAGMIFLILAVPFMWLGEKIGDAVRKRLPKK